MHGSHDESPGTRARSLAYSRMLMVLAASWPVLSFATPWTPGLLVNTEAFSVISDGDASADLELRFGESLDRSVTFSRVADRFEFNDDIYTSGGVHAEGTISGSKLFVSGTEVTDPLLVTRISTNRVGIGTNNPDRKLEVIGTASGRVVYAADSLRSSGTLVWEGAASGAALWVARMQGAGLTSCSNATNSKLLWNATTGQFSCGTDQTGGGGGGIMTLLGETTLGSANDTISVSLASSTEQINCYLSIKGTSTTSAVKFLRFNGDSGSASYGWNSNGITATATTDWQDASDSEIQITGTVGGDDPFIAELKITNFADTNKVILWDTGGVEPAGTNSNRYNGIGGWYNTGEQISSVEFILSTGTFNSGSHAWCEGRDVS